MLEEMSINIQYQMLVFHFTLKLKYYSVMTSVMGGLSHTLCGNRILYKLCLEDIHDTRTTLSEISYNISFFWTTILKMVC